MSMFTIRVELHDATWDDYTKLHAQLAARGITDVVVSDEGVRYKMSPAEYNYVGDRTIEQVQEQAEAAARAVGKRYAIFTSEAVRRRWTGLQQVR
jgi:hypothetical protein